MSTILFYVHVNRVINLFDNNVLHVNLLLYEFTLSFIATHESLKYRLLLLKKQEIYSMPWNQTDLSKFMIAGAQYGGPIAMIRDDKKVLLLQKQQPIKPTIYMYTSAGKLIEQIQ
ncbi:hypothetical protein K501DRAFT_280720, partial [Backusella circina FSU 941]